MFINYKDKRGTTLVEALVAVLILSMGMIPTFSIILMASSLSSSLKNNLIAANLAQEGVEVVRAMRDSNWFRDEAGNPRNFDEGLVPTAVTEPFDCTLGCRVESSSTQLMELGTNPELKIDSDNGLYNYVTGNDTGFRRTITITEDPSSPGCDCELMVVSEVTWSERGRPRSTLVELHLFDWK